MAVIKLIFNHIKRIYTTTERFNGDAPAQRGPDSASTADGDADVVGHGRHCRSGSIVNHRCKAMCHNVMQFWHVMVVKTTFSTN